MKKICKTMAAVLSAALLINSMFAVSTMKVYAEPAEENMTENEGTPETPGTTDTEGDTLPDEDLLTDEEIAQLLAGDGAVSVFAARSANTLGKFSMTFKDGNLEYTKVIYAIDYPQEDEDWVWKDYTGGIVDAVRVIIIPKGEYPIAVVVGSVTASGMDPEGDPPTNNIDDYNLSGTIEDGGGLWLMPGCTYEFTGLEIEELKPAKLNVAEYAGNSVENSGSHDDQVYWINDTIFQEGNNVWQGGEGAFLPGTVVTITLIPDRGFQLTEFKINNEPNSTQAQGEISTFTFTVPNANFHLGAKFTPMEDKVDSKVSGIAGGTLNLATNEYANGTAALTVNTTTVSSEEEAAFENAQRDGFEVAKYVDLKLENRFYKGNTTDFWTTTEDKTNLRSSATISLSLSDITADDFEIVHQKHDGTYEVLDATYSNGSVTFSTNSFSKFAIVAKSMKNSQTPESGTNDSPTVSTDSDENDDEGTSSTVTTENNTTLGTVVGGSDVKDWNGLEKILENKTSIGDKTTVGNSTATAPIVLKLNQRNSTVPASTLKALEASESLGLHLMMGNGAAITIANGAGLKNQPAINLSNKVETTRNSKTISFASNTKLNALVALHMSVPKNVKEVKLYYYINGHAYFLGTLTTLNGQVLFPISQLGIYKLVY